MKTEAKTKTNLRQFIARKSWVVISDANNIIIGAACPDCRNLIERPNGGDIIPITPQIGMGCCRCGCGVD